MCTQSLRQNNRAITSSFSSSGFPFRDRRSTSRQLQNQEGTIVRWQVARGRTHASTQEGTLCLQVTLLPAVQALPSLALEA